jgi:DNA excision repair protein ERCC-3
MTDALNPLIVQGDLTVLLETASPLAEQARAQLAKFAELEKAPEHIHTYRITPLSLWNAAVSGVEPGEVAMTLTGLAKYAVPGNVLAEVHDQMGRYGRLRIVRDFDSGQLAITTAEPALLAEVARDKIVGPLLGERLDGNRFAVRLGDRGVLKQALLRLGWPAADEAGYEEGSPLANVELTAELRGYQADAVNAWWAEGSVVGGNGVLVLPCGAGKTVIGLAAMAAAGHHTLIVATNIQSARQWMREILMKTSATADMVGEYSGDRKEIKPITVATYQVLTWSPIRKDKKGKGANVVGAAAGFGNDLDGAAERARLSGAELIADVEYDAYVRHVRGEKEPVAEIDLHERYPHLGLLDSEAWGLIIYDEVHLLPAPVFRATARMQAVRRLGLTATLVREDGREGDVFTLIGPKRFDAPWKELESQGWIAPATCTEIRVSLPEGLRMEYASSEPEKRYRIAASAPAKLDVIERIVELHPDDHILVIGQFIEQLEMVAKRFNAPLITGKTTQALRESRFEAFRIGETPLLVVSKVANFSIDLPEANVAIQISGTFGSRQEEAQRLGRVLRPKADGGPASFYTIVARETVDQQFAMNRQRFLAEQGYAYRIMNAEDL